MNQRSRQENALHALRMLPMRWAILLVVLAIGYVVLQPRLNHWFGWSLPSAASWLGEENASARRERDRRSTSKASSATVSKESATKQSNSKDHSTQHKADERSRESNSPSKPTSDDSQTNSVSTSSKPKSGSSGSNVKANDGERQHGILVEIGRDRYESPAGLVYGPGSEEGHRLRHIERHLEDQPDRPGSHGVFNGDMPAFLKAIDETYSRAQQGAKGTKKKVEDDSTVYEASFDKAIGFIGGQEGKRKKNPTTKRMRIVVRGKNLITAFPF